MHPLDIIEEFYFNMEIFSDEIFYIKSKNFLLSIKKFILLQQLLLWFLNKWSLKEIFVKTPQPAQAPERPVL